MENITISNASTNRSASSAFSTLGLHDRSCSQNSDAAIIKGKEPKQIELVKAACLVSITETAEVEEKIYGNFADIQCPRNIKKMKALMYWKGEPLILINLKSIYII